MKSKVNTWRVQEVLLLTFKNQQIRKQFNVGEQTMKNQVKVTAINETGATITSGWFQDVNKGEEYANAMTTRGFIVVKQYK